VEYACGYELGRSKDDPVYAEVTEGRDDTPFKRAKYSSCGDLAHFLLQRLGVREKFINRDENKPAGDPWVSGTNVSDLAWCNLAITPDKTWTVQPGDILIVWNHPKGKDAHVCVAVDFKVPKLKTGNYGAGGMQSGAWPGARLASADLRFIGNAWYYGSKRVHRVIPLEYIVEAASVAPNFRGASMTGEDLDALGAVE
jgi:hypothetical protein